MTTKELLYKTIRKRSASIINQEEDWKKEISSAKNYIATPDLTNWTFGKSAGLNNEYHANGGTAKKWLYSLGFTNVLQLPDGNFKKNVIASFLAWANTVETFDIVEKFNKDQKLNKRFELLIDNELVSKELILNTNISESNQDFFNEGFKKEITHEIISRDSKIRELAKTKHGTKCSVCSFDFGLTYGFHGEGFIEIHHLHPISLGIRKTTISDLRPVCANCHRMLHKGDRLLSIKELREIIQNVKNASS